MPSTPWGPSARPRRFARSRSSKTPSGLCTSASLRPDRRHEHRILGPGMAHQDLLGGVPVGRATPRAATGPGRCTPPGCGPPRPRRPPPPRPAPATPGAAAARSTTAAAGSGRPTFIRRRTSAAVRCNRDRSRSITFTPGGSPGSSGPSGGSAISPHTRYDNPRVTRSWVSNRPATSIRNALPTRSVDNPRNRAWAASMTVQLRAHPVPNHLGRQTGHTPTLFEHLFYTTPLNPQLWTKPQLWITTPGRCRSESYTRSFPSTRTVLSQRSSVSTRPSFMT